MHNNCDLKYDHICLIRLRIHCTDVVKNILETNVLLKIKLNEVRIPNSVTTIIVYDAYDAPLAVFSRT